MSEAVTRLPARTAGIAAQVRSLQQQIADLSARQRDELLSAIGRACALAAEVAENPAQPPGVRDLARRFVEDEEARAQNIRAVAARVG